MHGITGLAGGAVNAWDNTYSGSAGGAVQRGIVCPEGFWLLSYKKIGMFSFTPIPHAPASAFMCMWRSLKVQKWRLTRNFGGHVL